MARSGTVGKTGRTARIGLATLASLTVVVCGFVVRTVAVEPCPWSSSDSDLNADSNADRIDDLAEEIKEPTWFFPAALNAWPAVPLRDVVRAADALHEAGFDEIEYIGVPPMK